jgi:hypothetical protein
MSRSEDETTVPLTTMQFDVVEHETSAAEFGKLCAVHAVAPPSAVAITDVDPPVVARQTRTDGQLIDDTDVIPLGTDWTVHVAPKSVLTAIAFPETR